MWVKVTVTVTVRVTVMVRVTVTVKVTVKVTGSRQGYHLRFLITSSLGFFLRAIPGFASSALAGRRLNILASL